MKRKATVEEVLSLQKQGFTKDQIAEQFEYATIKALETFMRRNKYYLRDGMFVLQGNTLENERKMSVSDNDVIQCNTKDVIHCNTSIDINPKEISKIKYLIDKFDVIQDIIKTYESKDIQETSITKEITIDLPEAEDQRASVWVNSKIWGEFGDLCSQFKTYTKKELLSRALQEFINKYK